MMIKNLFRLFFLGLLITLFACDDVPETSSEIEVKQSVQVSKETEVKQSIQVSKKLSGLVIGGDIEAFRQKYGKEQNILGNEDVSTMEFGNLSVNLDQGILASVESNESQSLSLSQNEALALAKSYLPQDAVVLESLQKEVYANPQMKDIDTHTFIETYFSPSLSEILPEGFSYGGGTIWKEGSIKISLIQSSEDPSKIAAWMITTDIPENLIQN